MYLFFESANGKSKIRIQIKTCKKPLNIVILVILDDDSWHYAPGLAERHMPEVVAAKLEVTVCQTKILIFPSSTAVATSRASYVRSNSRVRSGRAFKVRS